MGVALVGDQVAYEGSVQLYRQPSYAERKYTMRSKSHVISCVNVGRPSVSRSCSLTHSVGFSWRLDACSHQLPPLLDQTCPECAGGKVFV
jgi:hypothetical protein